MTTRAARAVPGSPSRLKGYTFVIVGYLIMGSIGAIVRFATVPESMLLVMRFATAGIVLAALFARKPMLAQIRRPGVPSRLLVMGLFDSFSLLLFFIALRETSVAVGMFVYFIGPVFVALFAPFVFKDKTDRIVFPALAVALAGLVAILMPSLLGEGVNFSTAGITAAVAGAVLYACFVISVKALTRHGVGSVTIVLAESLLDGMILLPLALWQVLSTGYVIIGKDIIAAVLLGVLCTAVAYTVWTEGIRLVKVQHGSILGYLEPVSAPLYALLLGEIPTWWTVLGGALILGAGALVVLFGKPEDQGAPGAPGTSAGEADGAGAVAGEPVG